MSWSPARIRLLLVLAIADLALLAAVAATDTDATSPPPRDGRTAAGRQLAERGPGQ
ncbi:hypothetical protein ACIPSE_24625 [Streptomyces sp. NPDC090106]|uniref:hypothetical protein n=1 Tax=Streptomyces sp. NPDC090106 TaxID=3365946 RepID=UPI00380983F3